MDEGRIETTTGMCVVALTKHLMKKQNIKCWDTISFSGEQKNFSKG